MISQFFMIRDQFFMIRETSFPKARGHMTLMHIIA
jgi:hypothetical protein